MHIHYVKFDSDEGAGPIKDDIKSNAGVMVVYAVGETILCREGVKL